MPRVSLIKGDYRREITRNSLELVSDEIKKGLTTRQPVIKPNFVSSTIQLASSHVDQIRGILDFLSSFYDDKIIIAEAACYDTMDAYHNFRYTHLLEEYNVELIDLNIGPYDRMEVVDAIAKVKTNSNDKPLTNVTIISASIVL